MKTIFQKLKTNSVVHDTWYGPGKVVKKTMRSAYIKLQRNSDVVRYDQAHVNHFIRIGRVK